MTEVTVWSRVLANTELSAWAACKEVQGEKVVDWDTAILNVTGLQAGLKYIFHFLLEIGNGKCHLSGEKMQSTGDCFIPG